MSERVAAPRPLERDAAPRPHAPSRLLLQRKCACGAGAGNGGECDSCAAAARLQRRTGGAGSGPLADVPHSVSETLSRGGRPLDPDTRRSMERGFGTSFDRVRIHDDARAAGSAADVDAHAYTVGDDIVFGAGQYEPHTSGGQRLLAHELAHTVQQQGLQRSGDAQLPMQPARYWQLEHEADRAADRVMAGASLAPGSLTRAGAALQRKAPAPPATQSLAYRKNQPSRTVTLTIESAANLLTFEKVSGAEVHYQFEVLRLPAEKGPLAKATYAKATTATAIPGKLQARFDGTDTNPKQTGNEQRASDLQTRWLNEHKSADPDADWRAVGGDDKFPQLGNRACQVDHIQELQVGGTNDGTNLQLLAGDGNATAGGLLQSQLHQMALAAFADAKTRGLGQLDDGTLSSADKATLSTPGMVVLTFARVELAGAPKQDACVKAAQAFDEKCGKTTTIATTDFSLTVGAATSTLKLPTDGSTSVELESSTVPDNSTFAWSVPGLVFEKLGRPKGKPPGVLHFRLDTVTYGLSSKAHGGSKANQTIEVDKTGKANLTKAGKNGVPFNFSKLSPGHITSLDKGDKGLKASGTITPSVPFLPTLDVAIDGPSFKVVSAISPDKMKAPFPGLRFTKAELALVLAPEFAATGTLAFELGPAAKPAARGDVKAVADTSGLKLVGELLVVLPGIDSAKGTVGYQNGQWSANAHIESAQMAGKIPFMKSGAIDVVVKNGELTAEGTLILELPGKNPGTLGVQYSKGQWIFTGTGRFEVKNPYIDAIEASLWYDGETFKATGDAAIAVAGLTGTLNATYENKAGAQTVSGKGKIKVGKPTDRAHGSIDIQLHPNQKITGKGTLSYAIKKDLVATASVTLDEAQKIIFDGELSFPDIVLFKRFPEKDEDHPLFKASGSIPIPGASIGPIGLKVKLWGSLGYYYSVGPGVLTDIKATARFSPFDANPDFDLTLKAKASVPASGGLRGKVGADVALDLLVAEVGGGLNVEASAGLEGKAELGAEIAYKKGQFAVDASAYIGGGIVLASKLNARVYAEAGFGSFKARTEKVWVLAGGKFDTGLSLGATLPLHYDSVTGFRTPKASDIKLVPATLDLQPSSMLEKLFKQTTPSEKEVK